MSEPAGIEATTRRIMIVGGNGQLGQEMARTIPANVTVESLGRAELDITDGKRVFEVVGQLRPDVLVNCAAYTRVDDAETHEEIAFAVNRDGAGNVAEAAVASGARIIHVSTDFVFDGRASIPYAPDSPPNPLSVYGRSKLAGERKVLDRGGATALVIRTAWLYSDVTPNFVLNMLRLMRERDHIQVVADQIGSPTWARSLARALWRVVDLPKLSGVYHWTDAGVATWYDFAVAIHEEAYLLDLVPSGVTLDPVPAGAFPRPAPRPGFSVLDMTQTWAALGTSGDHWRRNLRQMLQGVDRG